MSWPDSISPNTWALLGSLPLLSALGVYTWRHRDAPAASPFLVLLLSRGFWVVFRLLELGSADFETKLLWFRLAQACLLLAAASGISVLAEFIRPGSWMRRGHILQTFLPAALIGALIFIIPTEILIWNRLWLDQFVQVARAPLAWVVLMYFACLYLVVCIRLVRFAVRWPLYRWPAGILLVGTVTTFLTDALVASGLLPRAPLDPTILTVDFNLTLYTLGGIGFRQALDILPVARDMAIKRMQDGIAVLNAQGHVVFQNPAAQALLGYPWQIIGDGTGAGATDLMVLSGQAAIRPTEILVEDGAQGSQYAVLATPLEDPRGWSLGNLLLFHDITDRQRARQLLVQQQRALAVLQERERIAAELHDDLGQVLGYVKLQTQAARDLLSGEDYRDVERTLAQMVSVTQEAHRDVREFILGARATALLEGGFSPALENYLEQLQKNFGLRTQLHLSPDWDETSWEPNVAVQLLRIIQEALTNARKHAQAKTVTVGLANRDGHVQVTVQDDGQGFDQLLRVDGQGLSFGLGFMRQRAASIGGTLKVHSTPGQGTRVIVSVPLQEGQA